MTVIRQLKRALSDVLNDFKSIFVKKKKRRSRRSSEPETVSVHKTWKEPVAQKKKKPEVKIIEQQKWRLPGYGVFKRFLAAFLLFLNFVFSQFLLGSVGTGAQPMFLIFLGNSFILVDYLWKTRQKKE